MRPHVTPTRHPRDAGISLVEVLVAMVLFAVVATAILKVLTSAVGAGQDDRARLVAQNLAARELEITRAVFTSPQIGVTAKGVDAIIDNLVWNPNQLPGQESFNGKKDHPIRIDGIDYTVRRTAQWSPVAPDDSPSGAPTTRCDAGSSAQLSYLRVNITVTWPGSGTRRPVRSTTLLTPALNTYADPRGHIGVKVLDRDGQPVVGVAVSATSAGGVVESARTAADGCALIAFLDPGAWSVKLAEPGYVDPSGSPTPTATVQVQSSVLVSKTFAYDRAASVAVRLTNGFDCADPPQVAAPGCYQVPPNLAVPLTLSNSILTPTGSRAVAGAGTTRTLTNLWPALGGYQMWAGKCLQNDPQSSGQDRDDPASAEPGGHVADATVLLGRFDVRALPTASGTITATQIVPSSPTDSQCGGTGGATAPVVSLGSPSALLRTSLPFGAWRITLGNKSADVTLTKDSDTVPTASLL